MTRRGAITWGLVLFWIVAGALYVAAALRQKAHLNLSPTAGGQMPYLVYAQHVAEEGIFGHFGDRNRMPLVPVLVSLVHDDDWLTLANRASWLAIGLSLALLAAMGFIAYRDLSPLMATAFLLIVAVAVFLPQASFVQADVAYYALFFCSWWFMVRIIERPTLGRAAALGLLVALTYLTKASVLLAMPIFLTVLVLRAIVSGRKRDESPNSKKFNSISSIDSVDSKRGILAAVVAAVVFLAAVFPYLQHNKERYGRYFYNVNTTFFVWCDSWAQAQRFAEKYEIDQHYPDVPAEMVPSPISYWLTHTPKQVGQRLAYGFKTLGKLTVESSAFKYLLLLGAAAGILMIVWAPYAKRLINGHGWAIAFGTLLLVAYVLVYSWYVVVAYGDRFVLSLVPPVLFALFLFVDRVASSTPEICVRGRRLSVITGLGLGLILFTLADGIAIASTTLITPSPSFVRFYFDESHEELRRGNLPEAERGMRGVVTLDPGFAAAHRDLGMIALAQQRHGEAIESLSRAAVLEPELADVQNSLGSALIQAGRLEEAVPVLERATILNPGFAPGWYNLCGVLFQLERADEARLCLTQLEEVSPELARQIKAAFSVPARKEP